MSSTRPAHPFADLIGLESQTQEGGRSVCRLTVEDIHMNPQGVVHGAVLYALADTGMGAALYPSLEPGELCATIEIKIGYFKAARSGVLECDTVVVHRGRRVAALESSVRCGDELLAKATGSYSIFRPRT